MNLFCHKSVHTAQRQGQSGRSRVTDIVTAVNPDDTLKDYLGLIDEPIFVCRQKTFEEHFPYLRTKRLNSQLAINATWRIYCPFSMLEK